MHGRDDSHTRDNDSDTPRAREDGRGFLYDYSSQRALPVRFWEKVQKVLLEHDEALAAQIYTRETQRPLPLWVREKV